MTDTLPISIPARFEAGRPTTPVSTDVEPGTAISRRLRMTGRSAVGVVLLAVLVTGILSAWSAGLRAFVVESPSMGEAAPVGTLVIGSTGAPVAVGDLITFSAPGAGATPYTHRVVEETAAGFTTRGDINGSADPWVITRSMIISRVVATLPGVGWLVKAAPALLTALVLAQIAGLFLRSPATRWSVRALALALGVALVSWTVRPFSGYVLLQSAAESGGMRATVVSTALLPIRLTAVGGGHVELLSGQVGRLLLPRSSAGHVTMTSQLALDPLGWALVAVACLIPVLVVLVFGVPVEEAGTRADA